MRTCLYCGEFNANNALYCESCKKAMQVNAAEMHRLMRTTIPLVPLAHMPALLATGRDTSTLLKDVWPSYVVDDTEDCMNSTTLPAIASDPLRSRLGVIPQTPRLFTRIHKKIDTYRVMLYVLGFLAVITLIIDILLVYYGISQYHALLGL